MKDTDTAAHIDHAIENEIAAMDLPTLDTLIAVATQLREQKHAERMTKLQEEAHALGATTSKSMPIVAAGAVSRSTRVI